VHPWTRLQFLKFVPIQFDLPGVVGSVVKVTVPLPVPLAVLK
jgi:hypothetical protein